MAREDEILERLDQIEIAVGQLAYGTFGPTVGGSIKSPLLAGFVGKFERRREEERQRARVAAAQRGLEQART